MIPALLLGRGGSVGFPGKNLFPVLGQPLMAYPILAAQQARTVDQVYLSTDSQKMKLFARQLGVRIIQRPPELATSTALGEDAYLHGYQIIRDQLKAQDPTIEALVLLFCNAPCVTGALIDAGVAALRNDSTLDSAVSVSAYNMWSPLRARRLNSQGRLLPFVPFETFGDPKQLNCDRDSQGEVFFADMGVSVIRPRCLENLQKGLLPQRWMGQNIHPLKQWGGLDVDYEWQIPQVEFWLKAHGMHPKPSLRELRGKAEAGRSKLSTIEIASVPSGPRNDDVDEVIE